MINWKQTIEQALVENNDDESHTEPDPHTFHASQIGNCKRQAMISKLGLNEHGPETLGNFLAGTLFHEWVEENIGPELDEVAFETPVSHREHDIHWVGHADVWDTEEDILYDLKTRGDYFRGGFQYLDPPVDRHLDQLTIYMRALEATEAQVVYVDKKNPSHVRTWPNEGTFDFDWERYRNLTRKAAEIKDAIEEHGIPDSKQGVPFEKDSCWICDKES